VKGLLDLFTKVPTVQRIIYTDNVDESAKVSFAKAGIELISFSQVEKLEVLEVVTMRHT